MAGPYGAVRSRASPTGDGEESESDAELSMREERIRIRSRYVIEYGVTKERRYLMKEQADRRGLPVRPDR